MTTLLVKAIQAESACQEKDWDNPEAPAQIAYRKADAELAEALAPLLKRYNEGLMSAWSLVQHIDYVANKLV